MRRSVKLDNAVHNPQWPSKEAIAEAADEASDKTVGT